MFDFKSLFAFGTEQVNPFTTLLHYRHLKKLVICILIEIISLRLSRVVLFSVIFLYEYSFSKFSTLSLRITAFLVLHVFAKFSKKES